MPELPEVETIVRALRNGGRGGASIIQRKIISAELLWNKTLASPSLHVFQSEIINQTVEEIHRRGKFIVISLDNGYLLTHLRMSGDLRVDIPPLAQPLPHDRFLLNFQDGSRLAFNDTRKFGRVWFTHSPDSVFKSLGIEPFDESLSVDRFYCCLQRKKKQIKFYY